MVTFINNTSNHPTQHKYAALHLMINRLVNIPLNQTDYNTEFNTIKYMAQENGYDSQLIESLIKNAKRRKLQNNNKETRTDKKSITLTHHNKSTQKMAKTIKKTGIQHSIHQDGDGALIYFCDNK